MTFLTGLDWSGDAGDRRLNPDKPSGLVIGLCSASFDDLPHVEAAVRGIKASLGLAEDHVFHHVRSGDRLKMAFFKTMEDVPIRIVCHHVDRSRWLDGYLRSTSGTDRLMDAIASAVVAVDSHMVADGRLLVDQGRGEKAFVQRLRRSLGRRLALEQRKSFSHVSARSDRSSQATLIQIADMFAGEVRRSRGSWNWNANGRLRITYGP